VAEDVGLIFLHSLRSRIRLMHALWQAAASDMDAEQVNYRERDGVLPLACSFAHTFISEDATLSWYLLGQESLWRKEGWQQRVDLSIPIDSSQMVTKDEPWTPYPEGSPWVGIPVEVMQHQHIGSWESWKDYQSKVVRQTDNALEQISPDRLLSVAIAALPVSLKQGYIGQLVGEPGVPVRLLDVVEATIYAHGLRHIGEVEYGRSLVGLAGLTM